MNESQYEAARKAEQDKKTLQRQRSNAFNSVNMSMTSQHSYFYQAGFEDDLADITDSSLIADQTNAQYKSSNLEDINLQSLGVRLVSEAKKSPKNQHTASHKSLKTVQPPGATKGSKSKVKTSQQDPKQLFTDFYFNNPEMPDRDKQILKEIDDHRKAVRTQIELKRHSYQKTARLTSDLKKANDLIKSQTELKSLKTQVMQ